MARKNWQDLTIADNFIFGKVLENDPTTCKLLLETILGFEIDSIEYPEREKTIETRHDSKGIRLDVFTKTPDGQRYLMWRFRPAIMTISLNVCVIIKLSSIWILLIKENITGNLENLT